MYGFIDFLGGIRGCFFLEYKKLGRSLRVNSFYIKCCGSLVSGLYLNVLIFFSCC